MSKRNNRIRKDDLALAIAGGKTIKLWAEKEGIPVRTAYHWANLPEVLEQVEAHRRRLLDEALGTLSDKVAEAALKITELAQSASSESVQLQAARTVINELMSVAGFTTIERRMVEIERRLADVQPAPRHATGRMG